MPKTIEDKLLGVLKKKKSQKILDISTTLGLDRHTVSKYLEVLKSKGLVDFTISGKSKLWSLSNNSLARLLGGSDFVSEQVLGVLRDLDYDVSIQSRELDVIWQSSVSSNGGIKGKCFELKGKKCKCVNCPSDVVFESGEAVRRVVKGNRGEDVVVISKPIKNDRGVVVAVLELSKAGDVL